MIDARRMTHDPSTKEQTPMFPSRLGFAAGIAGLGIGLGLLAATRPVHADTWRITGRGGDLDLGETPVILAVPSSIPEGAFVLSGGNHDGPFPAVVFREGERTLWATVLPRVRAKEAFTLAMKPQPGTLAGSSEGVRFRPKGRNLLVTLDEKRLTEYCVDAGHKPFFFPLIGPTGDSYTRAYPMQQVAGEDHDHPHQRSCWFTHGDVNGVDFWGEATESGSIHELERKVIVEGPVIGRLWTRNEWRAADHRKVCDDERTVTFYRTRDQRIIDFDVRVAATAGPVTFRDTKEGMFGVRVASSMDVTKKRGGRITNAEGLSDEGAWGKASPWVDYVGPVNGKTVGIAILNHPDSFRFPTTWHVRTYGLFAANPFGWHDFGRPQRGDFTVGQGQSIRFAYRLILHEGATAAIGLPRLFEVYARPLSIAFQAE
jgi:hypothetical protein